MIHKSVALFGVLILAIQLININPDISVPEYTFGELSQRTERERYTYIPTVTSALLAASDKSYEGLLFVGDVFLGRNVEYLMERKGSDYPYRGIQFNEIAQNAAVVGNFESAIPKNHIQTPENMLRFSVHEKFLPSLYKAGFTHMSLANNHSFDYQESGFKNSVSKLKEAKITPFGISGDITTDSVTYVDVDDRKIALIGLETLSRTKSKREFKELISFVSERSDFQIIYVHWGVEYDGVSGSRQRELAATFVEAGADLVVGHHPHVVQEVGLIDGVPVFYSLGNYIFDQYFSDDVKESLLISINFQAGVIDLIPVTSVATLSQPHNMQTARHYSFLAELAEKSNPSLEAQILSGQVQLKTSVASSSKMAMIYNIK